MVRLTSVSSTARCKTTLSAPSTVSSDWTQALPVIHSTRVTLRALRLGDAPTLLAMLTTEEVTRFISPPPTTVEGFERFIEWTLREQAAGRFVCFGIVPDGQDSAVGIIQVHALEPSWAVCEWGFALGSCFWGTGIFIEAARAVAEFVFDTIGAQRIEARVCVENGRGAGALQKLGAFKEADLRESFTLKGRVYDQCLWAICVEDWHMSTKAVWGIRIH